MQDGIMVVPTIVRILEGMLSPKYVLSVSHDYATEVLVETPVVTRWLDAPCVDVFIGEHPSLGKIAIVLGTSGQCAVLTNTPPIMRHAAQHDEVLDDPIVLSVSNEAGFVRAMQSDWEHCLKLDFDQAIQILSMSDDWQLTDEAGCFQTFRGTIPMYGEVDMLMVILGECYIYTDKLAGPRLPRACRTCA